jgi:hypothetical protein
LRTWILLRKRKNEIRGNIYCYTFSKSHNFWLKNRTGKSSLCEFFLEILFSKLYITTLEFEYGSSEWTLLISFKKHLLILSKFFHGLLDLTILFTIPSWSRLYFIIQNTCTMRIQIYFKIKSYKCEDLSTSLKSSFTISTLKCFNSHFIWWSNSFQTGNADYSKRFQIYSFSGTQFTQIIFETKRPMNIIISASIFYSVNHLTAAKNFPLISIQIISFAFAISEILFHSFDQDDVIFYIRCHLSLIKSNGLSTFNEKILQATLMLNSLQNISSSFLHQFIFLFFNSFLHRHILCSKYFLFPKKAKKFSLFSLFIWMRRFMLQIHQLYSSWNDKRD